MSWITVDVELDEVYSQMRDRDKQLIIDWLKEDGYLTKRDTEFEENTHPLHETFNETINKIKQSYHILSSDEKDLIEQIAKKY